jgi:hypothetical protein
MQLTEMVYDYIRHWSAFSFIVVKMKNLFGREREREKREYTGEG